MQRPWGESQVQESVPCFSLGSEPSGAKEGTHEKVSTVGTNPMVSG